MSKSCKAGVIAFLLACVVGAPTPTSFAAVSVRPPAPVAGWPQMAHDAQRTGYTPTEPKKPWTFAWHWKPDDMYAMPSALHAVTGGGKVYVPGGAQGLYAVNLADGKTAWRFSGGYVEEAAAYDDVSGKLFVGDWSGKLYRLDAATGNIEATYQADSAIRTGVLLAGAHAYVTSEAGKLHKVSLATMQQAWVYDAGVKSVTAPAYSPSRKLLIFGAADLTVHAVHEADGSKKWAKKPPTSHIVTPCGLGSATPAGQPYSYQFGFPVIAEAVGVVFVRMRLGEGSAEWLWASGPKGRFPATNAGIRDYLRNNRHVQSLFALSLDSGNEAFIPAVGNGGIDSSFAPDCGNVKAPGVFNTIGPMPVVKTFAGGAQAAYVQFRNGDVQDKDWDGRWDAHPGEMILSPMTGWQIGDMRFIPASSRDVQIADEQGFASMAGSTLFINHWMTINPITIADRSAGRGRTYVNPLRASFNPIILRRAMPVARIAGSSDPRNRYFRGPVIGWCDGRWYDNDGFWMYWMEMDPPSRPSNCQPDGRGDGYGDAHRPRYTIVSDGYILVIGHGGDVFALRHAW